MEWLKAKIALLIIAVMWLSLIVLNFPYMVYAYVHDRRLGYSKNKLHSVLLGQDIYINTMLGGFFRTTISSELGNQSKKSKSGKIAANVVDWLFELAGDGPNHCVNAIESEDKHWFNAGYAIIAFVLWLLPITFLLTFI